MDDPARQNELREQLNATSQKFLDSIDELHALEGRKREEAISTPPFHALADEVVEKTRDVFRLSTIQDNLGDAIETGAVSLNDVSPDARHDGATDEPTEPAVR